jgi:hypothetical protein
MRLQFGATRSLTVVFLLSFGRCRNLMVLILYIGASKDNRMPRRISRPTKGSLPRHSRIVPASTEGLVPPPTMGDEELQTLHVRVIALESLVVSLLASASDRQRKLTAKVVAYISPRSGAIRHQLTVKAATHVADLVKRATPLRRVPSK